MSSSIISGAIAPERSFPPSSLPESLGIPRLTEVGLDLPVLGFSVGVTTLCAVLVGIAPALQTLKRDQRDYLHAVSRSVTAASGLRGLLVVTEVALAVVLVVGAGLMVRSFARLSRVDAGFHAEHILTVRMMLLPVPDEALRAANRTGGDVSIITPGYFRALGIPIMRGRDFDGNDRSGRTQVAILNRRRRGNCSQAKTRSASG